MAFLDKISVTVHHKKKYLTGLQDKQDIIPVNHKVVILPARAETFAVIEKPAVLEYVKLVFYSKGMV